MHSDEWDIPLRPVCSSLRLVAGEGPWFMVLSPNLDTDKPCSWAEPGLAPLPGSDHCQLLLTTETHTCLGAASQYDTPGELVTAMGSIMKQLEHRVASQALMALLEAARLHSCRVQVSCQKHQTACFPGWFESRVRGAKPRLLAGWKTGKQEHKCRLRL